MDVAPSVTPKAMHVLAAASPLRAATRFRLSMTPTSDCSSGSPGLACCSPWPASGEKSALEVQYASDDESCFSGDGEDEFLGLEEVYSFDRQRIAQLAQSGACLEELTEAILMDMVGSLERFLTSEQILNVAVSGDGTIANVGIKVDGSFQCSLCNQRFDAKQQRDIHNRFVHGHEQQEAQEKQEALVEKAVACARRKHRNSISRAFQHSPAALALLDEEEEDEDQPLPPTVTRRRGRKSEVSPKAFDVDARIQRAVVAAMARRDVASVLPTALMGTEARRRRRASIG